MLPVLHGFKAPQAYSGRKTFIIENVAKTKFEETTLSNKIVVALLLEYARTWYAAWRRRQLAKFDRAEENHSAWLSEP